jgi:hypothetical protein
MSMFINFIDMEVNEIVYHIFGREIAAARICERDLSASALLK